MIPGRATSERYALAEGPYWDAARRSLWWVDIEGHVVCAGELVEGRIVPTRRFDFAHTVGAVVVAVDGSVLVAGQERLHVIESDGQVRAGPRILGPGSDQRLNDGSTDPVGRFVVGSLSLSGVPANQLLVSVDGEGRIERFDQDLTLSNGLAWSSSGNRMFSVDTMRRCIFVRDYEPETGAIGARRVHLQLEAGLPDGIAMDENDHLWVAVWGSGEVRRYDDEARLIETVVVPAPNTTCVAFAGDDLRTLVITTASVGLSDREMRRYPDSGCLFTMPTEAAGLPVPAWSGFAALDRDPRVGGVG